MGKNDSRPPRLNRPATLERSLHLVTLAGIQIRLDSSLIIIFALLVYVLAASVLPTWHPDWGFAIKWTTAVVAGIFFFASVLVHELAHSMVAKHFGIDVPRITLFLFGGLAEIEKEPDTPRIEFLIAIAGPLASLSLGILFSLLGSVLAGPDFMELLTTDQAAALATLPPLATLLFWLGPVNIVLGLFNLAPGFPLDGGRVLRAAIWWITGDLYRATRAASESGRIFGWCLMVLGAMQALSGTLLQGLWLFMIGWFLSNAASAHYKQLIVREVFRGVTARNLMRSHFETVNVQQSVADFIDNHLLQSSQMLWPVTDDGELVGLVTLDEVKDVSTADRPHTIIGQVMRTKLSGLTLPPETDANLAMQALNSRASPLAIVEENKVIGLLSQVDTMKWLALHHG